MSAPYRSMIGSGNDHVPLALGHLGALANDQSVGAELREGLLEVEPPHVVQRHGDEARVEEVEHGVLVAADVGVDRQPAAGEFGVEGAVVEVGGRIAQEVPRAVQEGVGDVGLAGGVAAARGAGDFVPVAYPGQRADSGLVGAEVLHPGQHDGQVFLGYGHRAALFTVDDRDRRTPVTLPRDAPVVQAKVLLGFGQALGRQVGDDGLLGVLRGQAVVAARIHQGLPCGYSYAIFERRIGVLTLHRPRLSRSGDRRSWRSRSRARRGPVRP